MLDTNKIKFKCKKKNNKDKVDKYLYEDFDFFMWPYEEQTKIKHKVLQEYLYVWATKLGSSNNINYYDGFSGCGAYYDSQEKELSFGSPIIAKIQFLTAKRDFKSHYFLNDKNEENIENIKKVFNYKKINTQNIIYSVGDFERNIDEFLTRLEKNPKPTFFMIDPFGINASYKTISRIMKIPKTEVFFNFMYNFTRRFSNNEKSENNITSLFGTQKWKIYKEECDDTKEIHLKDLYREQLKKCAKYVYQYRMCFSNEKRTYYYLFHASNNRDGCSIMKDSFAKINNGNVEFLGPDQPNPDQLALIDLTKDKIENLRNEIWQEFKGKTVLFKDVVDKYLDSTVYLERHIKQAILQMKEEYATFVHVNPKTRTINYDDSIIFYNEQKCLPKQTSFDF